MLNVPIIEELGQDYIAYTCSLLYSNSDFNGYVVAGYSSRALYQSWVKDILHMYYCIRIRQNYMIL